MAKIVFETDKKETGKLTSFHVYKEDNEYMNTLSKRTGLSKAKIFNKIVPFLQENIVLDEEDDRTEETSNNVVPFDGGVVVVAERPKQMVGIYKLGETIQTIELVNKGDTVIILGENNEQIYR